MPTYGQQFGSAEGSAGARSGRTIFAAICACLVRFESGLARCAPRDRAHCTAATRTDEASEQPGAEGEELCVPAWAESLVAEGPAEDAGDADVDFNIYDEDCNPNYGLKEQSMAVMRIK